MGIKLLSYVLGAGNTCKDIVEEENGKIKWERRVREMVAQVLNEKKSPDMEEFEELMHSIAELPKEQQDKVTYFVQGVIVATQSRKTS